MITIQLINKVVATQDISLITKNSLSEEHFMGYEKEFNFVYDHWKTYGNVPNKETFISKFPDFPIVEVTESDKYLLDTLFEEHLYYQSVGVVQKVAELLKTDSMAAVDFLRSQMDVLQPRTGTVGTDIITQADERLKVYEEKMNAETPWFITTGFVELDDIFNGWAKGEEFVVFFARTGQGKSWVLTKSLCHAWAIGNRVGYISPEMSAVKIGYRFDTALKNFSNTSLLRGKPVENYANYIDMLKQKEKPFVVATPREFGNKVTVSKLRTFVLENKLDILGVDGITYLSDERHKRGDNKTTSLTNISEDLSSLSLELGIPILVVIQSNRNGVKQEGESGTPELEDIRDSDGVAQNATKVIALRQSGAGLEFGIKKNRDGASQGKLTYFWDIDKGIFSYIPADDDSAPEEVKQEKIKEARKTFTDGTEVF